ncbi:VanW family protein [Paenibacillus sp. y28]|uniref:VanW family protein n=1 Tax=Paenibacillus sp. y28 TaxID=3129110 RepID=UPI0030185BA1
MKLLRIISAVIASCLLVAAVCFAVLLAQAHIRPLPGKWNNESWNPDEKSTNKWSLQVQNHVQRSQLLTVDLTGLAPNESPVQVNLEQLGLETNASDLIAQLEGLEAGSWLEQAWQRWKWRNRIYTLEYLFEPGRLKAEVDRLWPDVALRQPVDAQRMITTADQVQYIPGQPVQRIDTELLAIQLLQALTAFISEHPYANPDSDGPALRITAPALTVNPAVTVETLRAEGIERKITEFTTTFSSAQKGRVYNIQSTAHSLHDTLLKPDEVFNYNDIIAATRRQFGYRPAPVIFNGQLAPGIGGGICQVSTTLYNAVLRAGLGIIERRNHSLPVRYVPLGQDATYAEGYINFQFRNTSGHHLLIRTHTGPDFVTVKLFGTLPQEISYSVRSRIAQTLPAPVKYVHNPSLPRGGSQVLQQGKTGYIVETLRTRLEHGSPVAEELISRDSYAPRPLLIAVNYGGKLPAPPSEPNHRPLLEDGVSGPIYKPDVVVQAMEGIVLID